MNYGYTRINGVYTAKTPWGEVLTAKRKDQLDHLMMLAEKREKQRLVLVSRLPAYLQRRGIA